MHRRSLDPPQESAVPTVVSVPPTAAAGAVQPPERRESVRHPAAISIEVAVPYEHRARSHALLNLSHGGLSYSTPRAVKPGTIVSIRIKDCDPPVLLIGQVTWTELGDHGYEVGVRFIGGNEASRTQVIEQVADLHGPRRAPRTEEPHERKARRVATVWAARHAATLPGARERH